MTRGFVTLAVGQDKYYQLAANLLKSYKLHSNDTFPFAIIADRKNSITDMFDKVILLEKPNYSYLDKIEIINNPPFDQNIFIDSDCLAYKDINSYWNYFPEKGVSCFGRALPLNSSDGWFEIKDIGEYKNQVTFIPQMHGGIMFFNRDETTKNIYTLAKIIIENYSSFKFKYFEKPADEPALSLSMAVYGIKPIELSTEEAQTAFLFLPTAKQVKMNISKGQLDYISTQNEHVKNVKLLHWQNFNTEKPIYKIEIVRLSGASNIKICLYYICYYAKYYFNKYLNKVKRKLFGISYET